MTIQELYDWAKENDAVNREIAIGDYAYDCTQETEYEYPQHVYLEGNSDVRLEH